MCYSDADRAFILNTCDADRVIHYLNDWGAQSLTPELRMVSLRRCHSMNKAYVFSQLPNPTEEELVYILKNCPRDDWADAFSQYIPEKKVRMDIYGKCYLTRVVKEWKTVITAEEKDEIFQLAKSYEILSLVKDLLPISKENRAIAFDKCSWDDIIELASLFNPLTEEERCTVLGKCSPRDLFKIILTFGHLTMNERLHALKNMDQYIGCKDFLDKVIYLFSRQSPLTEAEKEIAKSVMTKKIGQFYPGYEQC